MSGCGEARSKLQKQALIPECCVSGQRMRFPNLRSMHLGKAWRARQVCNHLGLLFGCRISAAGTLTTQSRVTVGVCTCHFPRYLHKSQSSLNSPRHAGKSARLWPRFLLVWQQRFPKHPKKKSLIEEGNGRFLLIYIRRVGIRCKRVVSQNKRI